MFHSLVHVLFGFLAVHLSQLIFNLVHVFLMTVIQSMCVVYIDRILRLHNQQLFLDKLTWLQARLLLALSMRL